MTNQDVKEKLNYYIKHYFTYAFEVGEYSKAESFLLEHNTIKRSFSLFKSDDHYARMLIQAIGRYKDPIEFDDLSKLVQLQAAYSTTIKRAATYTNTYLKILVHLGNFDQAVQHARLRADPSEQCDGMLAIVQTLIDKRDINKAPELLQFAFEITNIIQEGNIRAALIRRIAVIYGALQDKVQTNKLLQKLKDDYWSLYPTQVLLAASGIALHFSNTDRAYSKHCWDIYSDAVMELKDVPPLREISDKIRHQFALALFRMHDAEQGSKLLQMIKHVQYLAQTLRDLVTYKIETGDHNGALILARSIEDEWMLSRQERPVVTTQYLYFWSLRAGALAEAGAIDEAMAVLNKAQDVDTRISIWKNILAANCDRQIVDKALDEAHHLASVEDRCTLLRSIIQCQSDRSHQTRELYELSEKIEEKQKKLEIQTEIVLLMSETNHSSAGNAFEGLLNLQRQIDLEESRFSITQEAEKIFYRLLYEISDEDVNQFKYHLELSNLELAQEIIDVNDIQLALDKVLLIQYPVDRGRALVTLAEYARLHHPSYLPQIVRQASITFNEIDNGKLKIPLLRNFARVLADSADENALGFFEEAMQLAQENPVFGFFQVNTQQHSVAGSLATALARSGQIDRAYEIANNAPDQNDKAIGLARIAGVVYGTNPEQFDKIMLEAETVAQSVANVLYASAFPVIAVEYARVGKWVKAVSQLNKLDTERFIDAIALILDLVAEKSSEEGRELAHQIIEIARWLDPQWMID